jgi:lipid-binding SYLF domain-containing protein
MNDKNVIAAARTALTIALALSIAMVTSGCTTTASTTTAQNPEEAAGLGPLSAETRRDIRLGYQDALQRLDDTTPGSRELISKAAGILVFPQTISAGLVVGAGFGNGELRIKDAFSGYYRMTTGSLGFQIGAQSRTLIFLFMTQDALDNFRNSKGWSVGADASVAVLKVGANGAIDINVAQTPTVAFVMTNAGLMANLTLQGTKVTPIE